MDFQGTKSKVCQKEKFARIAKFKGCQIFLLYGTVSLTTPLNYRSVLHIAPPPTFSVEVLAQVFSLSSPRSPWWSGKARMKPASTDQLRNSDRQRSQACPRVASTHGVLGKHRHLRCGQPLYLCCNIMFHGQHLGVTLEEGAYSRDKMSDPAYKPPLRFWLVLRLQNGGCIRGILRYIYYTSTAKLVSCKIHCLPTMTAGHFACEVFSFFSLVLSGGASCRLLHWRYLYRVMEMNSCGVGGDLDLTNAPDP